jgi:hypothetical protein
MLFTRRIPFDYTRPFLFSADGGSGSGGGAGEGGEGGDGGSGGGQAEKTFTQADVDRIVQDRLARAKSAPPADYEDLKAKAAKFDELDAANKSELEKAQEAARKATEERAKAVERANAALRRGAVTAAAVKAGAVDPDAVLALIAQDAVTVGDDGQVTGAEEAVTSLLKDKPYLVGKQPKFSGGADGGARGGDVPSQLSRDDLKNMTPQQIVKAREEGRLKDLMGG